MFFWEINKRATAICFLVAYIMDGFGLSFMGKTIINSYNVLFVIANLFLLRYLLKDRKHLEKNKVTNFMLLFYNFLLLSFLFTYFGKIDTLKYSSSVLRQASTPFLLYFIAIRLKTNEIEKSLKYLSVIYAILAVLYCFNLMGIPVYSMKNDRDYDMGSVEYARSFSFLYNSIFFFFYALIYLKKKHKYLSIIYLINSFFGAARGNLVSIIASICVTFAKYYRRILRPKVLFPTLIVLIPGILVYNNFFKEGIERGDTSLSQQIENNFDLSSLTDYNSFVSTRRINGEIWDLDKGTLAFRTSIALERLNYLIDNPKYLLFGIGMIDEASPNNRFHFILGTQDNHYRYGYAQIDSVDTIWPAPILRYGLVGICFLLFFFYIFFRFFNKSSTDMFIVGKLYILFLFFNSFGQNSPTASGSLILLFLVYRLCYLSKDTKLSIK